MVIVLLLMCAYFSVVTWDEQFPEGVSGARQLAATIIYEAESTASILVVTRGNEQDVAFADELTRQLTDAGLTVVGTVKGEPPDARRVISQLVDDGKTIDIIACTHVTSTWGLFDDLGSKFAPLTDTQVMHPASYGWPNFLKTDNMLNVANQIAVIAIIAVGMTMVVITAGIDLSVGSLIALSAVVTTRLIRDMGGAQDATVLAMIFCCLGGVVAGGAIGTFSGSMVAFLRLPPFIVTLAMMLVARGLAYILAAGQSIDQVPDSFVWLGRGDDLFNLPNAVVLMLILYGVAHVVMTRMSFGRYVYAVGGNIEAARLSGVPVRRMLVSVYAISGVLGGLGGVVMASQLKSGAGTYGVMYELYVIAAAVVGGTSLAGGQGKVIGTLVGAFIIAVIRNGMNLTGVESYTQDVVLGLVILGAVLLDTVKRRG